jgi:hypothetical protein
VTLRSWIDGERTLGRFEARLDEAAAAAWAEATAAAGDASAGAPAASADAGSKDGEGQADEVAAAPPAAPGVDRIASLRDEVAAMQRRFDGRVFVLPAFKAANLNRDLDAYLKPAS